jgi:hypothetical protein
MSANPNDASAVSIKSSVGRRGMNIRGDVILIQELLNRRLMVPMRPLRVDGTCGPITISTIEEFQRRVVGMPSPDGLVNPGGPTMRALLGNGVAAQPAPAGRQIAWGARVSPDRESLVKLAFGFPASFSRPSYEASLARKEVRHLHLQLIPRIKGDQISFLVHEPHARDGADAKAFCDGIVLK